MIGGASVVDMEGGDEEPKGSLPSLPVGEGARDATFPEFYRSCERRLVRMLIAQGASLQDAEDTVQQAMGDLFMRWTNVDNPRTYAATAALHAFYQLRKASNRLASYERRYSEREAVEDGRLDALAEGTWVIDLLRRLPQGQREVLCLRDVEKYSTAETAVILGKSEDTVRSTLCQARQAFQALVAEVQDVLPRQRGQAQTAKRGGTR